MLLAPYPLGVGRWGHCGGLLLGYSERRGRRWEVRRGSRLKFLVCCSPRGEGSAGLGGFGGQKAVKAVKLSAGGAREVGFIGSHSGGPRAAHPAA